MKEGGRSPPQGEFPVDFVGHPGALPCWSMGSVFGTQLLSDGTRLLITWTEADTAFLHQTYTYSASVGEIQGVVTGKDGIPRDEYGIFNVSTRTLTVFGKADLPDGSWSGWRTVWRFVSDDELQKRQYLVGSDGEEGLFSEAFCFRRG